ncbi:MAG: ABC transporter ATP-binding protein [Faecousia sp.]
MNAIQTHLLTKRFKEKTAVDALELTVPVGELFALLGVNGAGKTTTIKLLSGLLAPTSGEAEIFGISILSQKIKHLLAVSPQETAVAPNLTVRENLELMAGIADASRKEAKARAEAMLDEAHLCEVAEKRAKTLSGGWQRRLSIAMALISEPKLLFLDEPTLGLDVLARRELWREIKALKGRITVVLTTHYMEEAEQLADRVGIMANGKLRVCGTPAELIARAGKKSFEDAFVALAGGVEA